MRANPPCIQAFQHLQTKRLCRGYELRKANVPLISPAHTFRHAAVDDHNLSRYRFSPAKRDYLIRNVLSASCRPSMAPG